MKIILWKGYHSPDLIPLIEEALDEQNCLIICPPYLDDIQYLLPLLPAGKIETLGDWENLVFIENKTSLPYPQRPILGVFTSGTTRTKPRLVLYSKKNLDVTLNGVFKLFDLGRLKGIYSFPQPFHAFGLVLGYVASVYFQKQILFERGECSPFSLQRWLEIKKEMREGLLTLGTPTHFLDLLFYANFKGISPLSSYASICGGAKVTKDLWNKMYGALGIEFPSIGYGCTEASLAMTHLPPGLPPIEDGEIGMPIDGVQLKLTPDSIEVFPPSLAIALLSGDGIVFPNSFSVKDKIHRRSDSVLVFSGRTQVFLNRGGEKYLLEEIETLIHDKMKLENICVPIIHQRLGEELGVAFIKDDQSLCLKELKVTLISVLKEKYKKRFSDVKVLLLERIPSTPNGKIDREKVIHFLMNGA